MEIIANQQEVTVINHNTHQRQVSCETDPLGVAERISEHWQPAPVDGLPVEFTGGWVGYCGYDTVRYSYASKDTSTTRPEQATREPVERYALMLLATA